MHIFFYYTDSSVLIVPQQLPSSVQQKSVSLMTCMLLWIQVTRVRYGTPTLCSNLVILTCLYNYITLPLLIDLQVLCCSVGMYTVFHVHLSSIGCSKAVSVVCWSVGTVSFIVESSKNLLSVRDSCFRFDLWPSLLVWASTKKCFPYFHSWNYIFEVALRTKSSCFVSHTDFLF
jgi:hypothetical protein